LLSSIIVAGLLDNERKTGGMETKWKLDVNTGDGTAYQVNGSIILNDVNAMAIRLISSDGKVVWTHHYTDPVSFNRDNNSLQLIDKHNGTSTLNFLGGDGSLEWSYSEPGLDGCVPFDEQHLYVHVSGNSTTNSILCLNGDGILKWEYTDNGVLNLWRALPNGTAILEDDNFLDELIFISPNGTEMGERNIFGPSYWYMGQASNGTILAYNMTGEVVLTADLQNMWSLGNQSRSCKIQFTHTKLNRFKILQPDN
jgi:hypothetical protein